MPVNTSTWSRWMGTVVLSALIVAMFAFVADFAAVGGPAAGDDYVLAQLVGGSGTSVPSEVTRIENLFRSVANILATLAVTLAMIFIVLSGIKYITSQGDARAIAEAKQQLVYAAIGLGIALAALVLSNLVKNLVQSNL